MEKNKKIILSIVVLVVVIGVSFYAGMSYASSKKTTAVARTGAFTRGTRTGGAGTGATIGSIVSADATSITLQSADGSSKIIYYSTTTQISKMTAGSSTDLTSGTNVIVQGTTNSDGTITAQSIQIRPAGQTPPTPPTSGQ